MNSFVKSITMDVWKPDELKKMYIGNITSNKYYEALLEGNGQKPGPRSELQYVLNISALIL